MSSEIHMLRYSGLMQQVACMLGVLYIVLDAASDLIML